MEIRRARIRALVWLIPTLVILMTGCATHRPVISTWRDSQAMPTRTDKIALTLQPQPEPENIELGRLLAAELKREGFDLVPVKQADYLMAYTWEDELADQGRSITTITPASPPQTTAQAMGQAEPTIPASVVSQPVVYRHRGIRLFLYNNPKTHPGGFRIVWQGYISAGQTASAADETALLKTLLGYLGQEHHGPVNLTR